MNGDFINNLPRNSTSSSFGISKSIAHIFKGTYVQSEEEKESILRDSGNVNSRDIVEKVLAQDSNIVLSVNEIYTRGVDINENMNREIMNIDTNVSKIKLNPPSRGGMSGDPFFQEMDKKITELGVQKTNNENDNIKSKDEISVNEKKRKEHADTLRNISSEKKVWLDQLIEDDLRDLTYKDHLDLSTERDYEYKIMLLIFEGIFLEKVQETIDRELSIRGKIYGWQAMDEESEEKRRLESEHEMRKRCEELGSQNEREREEENWKNKEEEYKNDLERRKAAVKEEWKNYFKKFWGVRDLIQIEEKRKNKIKEPSDDHYGLYVKVTKEVIFKLYKKICFNAWQFKNVFLAAEEFILLDYLKKYLLGFSDKNVPAAKEEEEALGILMNILTNLKDQAEVLTIEERERLNILYRAREKSETIGEARKELKDVRVQNKERHIKRIEVNNLNSLFLPSMLTIRTIIFLTIGNRRIKSYGDIISNNKKSIDKRNSQNAEIDGQIKLLDEVKKRLNSEKAISPEKVAIQQSSVDPETEYKKSMSAVADIKKSLNQLKQFKNDLENNYNNMIKSVAKNLIKPSTIGK